MAAGDPIEVGAATSVLQPGKSSSHTTHHLLLSGFKSEAGHAEPAAGVLGLLRLAAQVSNRTLRHADGMATCQLVTLCAAGVMRASVFKCWHSCEFCFAASTCFAGHASCHCPHPAPEDPEPVPALSPAQHCRWHRPARPGGAHSTALVQLHLPGFTHGWCQLLCVHGDQWARPGCRAPDNCWERGSTRGRCG